MSKTKSNPKETGYDWALFPQFYFLSAKILCKKLQDSADTMGRLTVQKPFLNNQICDEYGFPGHSNYHLIFPIIFNLKHGIELCIKTLGNLDRDSYLTIHDYKELFDYLINNVRDTKNKAIFEKLKNETWPVIKKYYFGTYIPANIEGDADIRNQAERYPHRENCYTISDNYEWITEKLVNTTIDDIDFLQDKFRDAWIKTKDNDPIYNDPKINNPETFLEKVKGATEGD